MRLAMLHPLTLIRRSLHLKLMLSAMLVIALIMAFSVYILYLGHAEKFGGPDTRVRDLAGAGAVDLS